MEEFFIVTPIGFEREVMAEVTETWPDLLDAAARPHGLPVPAMTPVKGGLTLMTDAVAAVQLNFFLKSASRILWRQARFKARDFPKLHERLSRLSPRHRLGTDRFTVKVAASRSRLGHEGRIAETARRAWGLDDHGSDDPAVFLRVEDDVCTVSLDTSGEHLHRRGLAVERGEAPLRETLAAFALRRLMEATAPAELRSIQLVDPLCGSGTFLLEAASLWGGNFQRSYRFQTFHGLPRLFQTKGLAGNYRLPRTCPFGSLQGRDRDPLVLAKARANALRAQQFFPQVPIELRDGDLLQTSEATDGVRRWVIGNPPYDERLAGDDPQELLTAILRVWRPERLGLLWPRTTARRLRWPSAYQVTSRTPLSNGGLDVEFIVARTGNSNSFQNPIDGAGSVGG